MKTLFNALKVSITFVVFFIGGCVKQPITPGDPPVVTPPVGPKPKLTVTQPEKGWYNESATITFSAQNADEVLVDGVKTEGSTIVLPNVKNPKTVVITAKNKWGSDEQTVLIDVFSERHTFLLKGEKTWECKVEKFSNDSIVWEPSIPDCYKLRFRLSNCSMLMGSCNNGFADSHTVPWAFGSEEKTITWSGPVIHRTIILMIATKFVIRYKSGSQWRHEEWEVVP